MTTTFLSLSEELIKSKTLKEKKELTERLSDFLGKDSDFSKVLIRPIITQSIDSINYLKELIDEEFLSINMKVYKKKSDNRISIKVVFLQNYTNVDHGLEEKVLNSLYENIVRNNLDILVDDITVNSLQIVSGKRIIR